MPKALAISYKCRCRLVTIILRQFSIFPLVVAIFFPPFLEAVNEEQIAYKSKTDAEVLVTHFAVASSESFDSVTQLLLNILIYIGVTECTKK